MKKFKSGSDVEVYLGDDWVKAVYIGFNVNRGNHVLFTDKTDVFGEMDHNVREVIEESVDLIREDDVQILLQSEEFSDFVLGFLRDLRK